MPVSSLSFLAETVKTSRSLYRICLIGIDWLNPGIRRIPVPAMPLTPGQGNLEDGLPTRCVISDVPAKRSKEIGFLTFYLLEYMLHAMLARSVR